ncbi:MAG: DUF3298 and DUF4163 domain-containing protein [Lachnospiraceae bacterium]|nr:DUF3298 and DUF4163 domain-containing protein [Lachnospiraceae bacterium]
MKKRWITALLSVAMIISIFSGCGKGDVPVAEEKKAEQEATVTEEKEPEATEEPAVEEEPEAKRPQPVIASSYESEMSADGEKYLVSYKNESLLISEESAKDFPELYAALNDAMTESDQNMKNDMAQDLEYAQEMYTDFPENFEYGAWENSTEITVARADEEVLSAISNFYAYSGGAHGIYGTGGINLETDTGKEITVDMAFNDKSKLVDMIGKRLREDYPDLTEEFDSFAADETLASYAKGEYDLYYALEPCSVSFYFGPYTFASYAAGAQEITFSYDELAGLINEKYVPQKDLPLVTGSSHFDIDSDGDLETISSYTYYPDGEEGYARIKVNIDDQEYELTTDVLGYDLDQSIARTSGGKVMLLITGTMENDYRITTVCDVTNGKLKELDSVWMNSWGRYDDDDLSHSYTYAWTDPDAMPMSEHMDIMSTYYGEKTYKLGDNGSFTSDDEYFMIPNFSMPLKTIRDVTADVINEDGEVLEKDVVIPAGSEFYLYRTDGVRDEKKDAIIDVWLNEKGGKIIRLHFGNEYPHKVNGLDENELFEMVYYAG